MEKDTILHFEDESVHSFTAKHYLNKEFPNYNLITDMGMSGCVEKVLKEIGGVEKIALVFTDGNLLQVKGWDVVEELREKGYQGPTVYTGLANLPKNKEDLYTDFIIKQGDLFVKMAKKYLEKGKSSDK